MPNARLNPLSRTLTIAGLLPLLGLAPAVSGQVLVNEQFNSGALDTSVFTFSGSGDESFFGRTQLNSPDLPGAFVLPEVSGGALRLRIDSFNRFNPGDFFLADEVRTRQSFAPTGDTVFTFDTRARFVDDDANPLAGGLVGGAFLFGVDANFPNPRERDEVDIELLSNRPSDTITTNIFNDEGFNTGGDFVISNVPGLDLTVFNDFRIEQSAEAIRFFVNDELIRAETENLAIESQNFRLNINAPDEFFGSAFNSALQPTDDADLNQTFFFEVDSLVITQSVIPEPTTLALLAGAGLLAASRRRAPR